MISPWAVVAAALPMYLLLLGGALLRKARIILPSHDQGVMRVVFMVMVPCYTLDKILGAESVRSGPVVLWSVSLGFLYLVLGTLIGLAVGKLLRLQKGTGKRTFAITSGMQNYGFTAVPVVEILWGSGALAVLFLHNIGAELAVWSFGVMLMSGETTIRWKNLLNGPIFAVVLAMLLVALRVDHLIVGPFRQAISLIGVGAFPLAVFITGCTIMDMATGERLSFKIIAGSVIVRLVLTPILIIAGAYWLPLSVQLKQVLVVQAAMPAAMTPVLLSRLYGGRPAIAVQVLLATTILSLLTLPFIISKGSELLELVPIGAEDSALKAN